MTWGMYPAFEVDPALAMLDAVEGELKRWPADDLTKLASLAMSRIKRRTKRGEDAYGRPFQPYSEAWAQTRKKTGRQVDHVDLLYEGQMYAALTPKARGGSAVVGFTSRHEAMKAVVHHEGRGHLPERPWFDIVEGTDDWDMLAQEAADLVVDRIESLGSFE
jgi:hypothetical protein